MKYKPGIVGEGSGSMGHLTFSRNRYGPHIKLKGAWTNPNTPLQQAVRSVWQTLANRWSNILTEDQRIAWRLYAAQVGWVDVFGDNHPLTGYSMFMRTNTVALGAGLAAFDDAPTNFTLGDSDETIVATISEATQLISLAFDTGKNWVNKDGAVMQIQMSRPVSPGVAYIPPVLRIANYIPGDSGTPPTSPETMDVPFVVTEDQKVLVVGRILEDDGRLSNPFRVTSTIAS